MSVQMNVVSNLQSLFNVMSTHQEVVLFPIGLEGENAINFFRFSNLLRRFCCIASFKMRNINERQFIYSVPVLALDHLPHLRETAFFVIAAPQKYRESVYQQLVQFGCKNVLLIGDEVQQEINSGLQNIYGSGQHLNWFMNYFYKQFLEMKYDMAEQNEICAMNYETFNPFRNRFRGKKVVIVATGPSLNNYKPIPHAIHIGVNFAWRNENLSLNYLVTNDNPSDELRKEMSSGFDKILKNWVGGFWLVL